MTDADTDIREAIRNKPDPTPSAGVDWVAVRDENHRRHTAAMQAGKTYLVGRPRWLYASLNHLR